MSFADELKELALTAPTEKDTEDVFNDESQAKLADYEASEYQDVGASRKAAQLLLSEKYKGKSISRKEMFDEDDDENIPLNPNLYYIGGDSEDDDKQEDEDDDQEEVEQASDEGDQDDVEMNGDSEAESDLAEGDLDEEDDDDEDDVDDGYDVSQFAQSNGNNSDKFQSLEDALTNKLVNKAVSEEVRKGQCIAQQMKVWDRLLEYRIQFQRILALANQLPTHDVFSDSMREFLSNTENRKIYTQCVVNVEKAFEQLACIRAELVNKYPEMKKSIEGKKDSNGDGPMSEDDDEILSDIASGYSEDEDGQPKRKRKNSDGDDDDDDHVAETLKRKKFKLQEADKANAEFHQKMLPFRNATLDKWYQRTKLASGKTAKGFTALEQPPVQQIETILQDQDRLLERTRTKRSQYKIIGSDKEPSEDDGGKQIIAEIFDDDDFYHHLLREVIERKTQDITDPLEISRHWIEIQKLRTKIKRKIDAKASKGRRIRYDVIAKLVSFMTPHDGSKFSEQAKDDLFSSLFGKQPVEVSKQQVKTQISKKDLSDFKLFNSS